MQFDLEATSEKRLIYFAVNRPRVRFDPSRSTSWGFFSLKLTVPLLVGAEEKKESLTIELTVPFAATLKKPSVALTDRFLTLNWGGLVEALSIHDLLQQYENNLNYKSEVQYVGQTKDPLGRLARARLLPVQRVHQKFSEDNDMLLLIQRFNVEVLSEEGDPADLEVNQNPVATDMLLKDRIDVIECALIRYFEGPEMHGRSDKEADVRKQRLREVVVGAAAVERVLRMDDGAHTEPGAARFITRRKTVAAHNPAFAALMIRRCRDAARAERDDHAVGAPVRAEQCRVRIAFDGESGQRGRLREKRRQPVAVVHAREAATEHTARPAERNAGVRECLLAAGRNGKPRTFDAKPQARRPARRMRQFAPLRVGEHDACSGAAAVDADQK
jgi:hypothetical protein